MNIVSSVNKKIGTNSVNGQMLREVRRKSNLSIREFAYRMGLQNGSSLLQYENGKKKISRFVIERLLKFRGQATVLADYRIPQGTLIFGEVHLCESCGVSFVRYNSRHKFHSHACQCRAWRKSKNHI